MSDIKSLDQSLNNLDLVLKLIDTPEINPKSSVTKHNNFFTSIHLFLERFRNFLVGDHCWYNASKARKIVKHYIWTTKIADKTDASTQKVEQIYDKLTLIKRSKGTYADRIEKGWIKECAQADIAGDVTFVRYKNMPKVSNRILFHLHANEFGANSTLEGLRLISPLQFTLKYLLKRQKDPNSQGKITKDLVNELRVALEIAESHSPLSIAQSQLIKAFKENTKLLIPGGWCAKKTGHTLYYEIIPETAHTSSFRIYNTGPGLEFHNNAKVGKKNQYQPYLEWKGVTNKKLMDDYFWIVINELRYTTAYKINGKENDTNYNAEDIYVGLRKFLEPKEENVGPPASALLDKLYMSPQSSGVCSERSLLAFLHTRMDYSEYQRFKCSIRLQTLVDKVNDFKNKIPFAVVIGDRINPKISRLVRAYFKLPLDPMIERNLIEKSHNKLLLTIERKYKDKIISKKYFTKAQSELAKISDYIEENKALRTQTKVLWIKWGYRRIEEKVQSQYFPTSKQFLHQQIQELKLKSWQIYLPPEICQNDSFKALFSEIKMATRLDGNIFYFKDNKNRDTLIRLENGALAIEQRKNNAPDTWWRFIPQNAFIRKDVLQPTLLDNVMTRLIKNWDPKYNLPKNEEFICSAFGSRHLVNYYSHWQSLKDPTKLCLQNKEGNFEYEAKYKHNKIQEVRGYNSFLGRPSKYFSRIEDASYIQEWYSSTGQLQKAELPRFGLTFTPDKPNHLELFSDQYPGYFVKSNEVLPELGSYRHYLVLENKMGQRKVLLPQQKFVKHPDGWETLLPLYAVELELKKEDRNSQKYCVLDICSDGKLESKSTKANLYLALVLTLVHQYQKAFHYLKESGSKPTAYSIEESTWLEELISLKTVNGDNSVDAAFMKVYAALLLAKNSKNHNVPLNNTALLVKIYLAYSKYTEHRSAIRITLEEEELLLKYIGLIAKEFNKPLVPPIPEPINADFEDFKLTYQGPQPSSSEFKKVFKTILITRPYEFITNNFNSVLQLAKAGEEADKRKLRNAISFLEGSKDLQKRNMALFLKNILDKPSQ